MGQEEGRGSPCRPSGHVLDGSWISTDEQQMVPLLFWERAKLSQRNVFNNYRTAKVSMPCDERETSLQEEKQLWRLWDLNILLGEPASGTVSW